MLHNLTDDDEFIPYPDPGLERNSISHVGGQIDRADWYSCISMTQRIWTEPKRKWWARSGDVDCNIVIVSSLEYNSQADCQASVR